MNRQEAEALLCRAVNNPSARFRDGQWEAIDELVNRRRKLLVVQRTGWGKSSVYFISTRILRNQGYGPTIIISPLLALMRNQIEAAARLGIEAVSVNSSNKNDWQAITDQILRNKADCLLISPERLANEDFISTVLEPIANKIGLLVVDEAHCISDWGHDFRPDYRRILNVLRYMPSNMPVLGTTATANDRVVKDIVQQLGDIRLIRGQLARESLSLQNLWLPDQPARLAWLSDQLPKIPGSGIVYALTQRDAEDVARWLRMQGINAAAYYSGVIHHDFRDTIQYREHLEDELLANNLKALVATSALGMGYDKPDLGFVIHYQAPGSVVSYYQQVGRAGRGIESALGVLLAGREDDTIHAYFRNSAFPDERDIKAILSELEHSDGMTLTELESALNLRHGQIEKALKYLSVLSPSPILKQDKRWYRTATNFQLDRAGIARLTGLREREWEEMRRYISHKGCLMQFLRAALDDPDPAPCGKCVNCIGELLVKNYVDPEKCKEAAKFLKSSEFPIKPKVKVPAHAFQTYSLPATLFKSLIAMEGRILSHWGDAGWGEKVCQGKHDGFFDDALVDAMAEMISSRWRPKPKPTWITCVPSLRHPELVPSLAKRLADRLGLPFVEAIRKQRDNEQQKLQQNKFHQCRNLDGVFTIINPIPKGPVLLVDDVIDSGWTMTVLAVLLRRQGSGEVFPVALASTASTSMSD